MRFATKCANSLRLRLSSHVPPFPAGFERALKPHETHIHTNFIHICTRDDHWTIFMDVYRDAAEYDVHILCTYIKWTPWRRMVRKCWSLSCVCVSMCLGCPRASAEWVLLPLMRLPRTCFTTDTLKSSVSTCTRSCAAARRTWLLSAFVFMPVRSFVRPHKPMMMIRNVMEWVFSGGRRHVAATRNKATSTQCGYFGCIASQYIVI